MTRVAGWRYGLLGLPLAFVALPLYVQLPNHYAREYGVPLSVLAAVLLATRLLDACLDPWVGRLVDRVLRQSGRRFAVVVSMTAIVLASGFALLVLPPAMPRAAFPVWIAACLVVTYLAYSGLTVAHQAWAARSSGDEAHRGSLYAWREGLALAGVLLASLLPAVAGWGATSAVLAAALAAGCATWMALPSPRAEQGASSAAWHEPWAHGAFRRLLAVFVVNGIATAIPATLVLFFVQDRLQAHATWEPLLLGAYFLSGACSMPLWMQCVRRIGVARSWLAGMLLAVAGFVAAGLLGPGDAPAFLGVCVLSGLALGSDLALPAVLLAGVVERAGRRGELDGLFFGWWNFASKWNLALAAGLGLPLLAIAGWAPGDRSAAGLHALAIAYVAVPCALKAVAAALLYLLIIRKGKYP